MAEILNEKLSSRKLWLGLALVIIGVIMFLTGDTENGAAVIKIGGIGYLGAETICDIIRGIFVSDDTETDAIECTLADLIEAEAEEE